MRLHLFFCELNERSMFPRPMAGVNIGKKNKYCATYIWSPYTFDFTEILFSRPMKLEILIEQDSVSKLKRNFYGALSLSW